MGCMKLWLCIADNEEFVIEAHTKEEAQADASIYNGSVIKELK